MMSRLVRLMKMGCRSRISNRGLTRLWLKRRVIGTLRKKSQWTKGRNPDKKITLVYALSRIQVVTDQEGAQIFLDGEYTGVETGSDGKAEVFDIDPGSHGVLISKAGFEEWKDNAVSFSAGQNNKSSGWGPETTQDTQR